MPFARISVIVRFRNEERWLEPVLASIRAQRCPGEVELVAVDNLSSDGSREIAERSADVVLEIDDYRPGAALNQAIAACSGDAVAVLSGHALPADDSWLEALTGPAEDAGHIGVYGAQVYPQDSRFLDKRDLDIFSDRRPREETADADFWNANSALTARAWECLPFDEQVVELEDHYWTKLQLPAPGRSVRFEPTARVYHYGHDERNDRTFLPPGDSDHAELIRRSIAQLESRGESWPAVMSAGLTIGSLSHIAEAQRAIPAVGRRLLDDPDFDVRWRMAHVLGRIGASAAAPYLVAALGDRSFYPRDEAAWALARIGPAAIPTLLRSLPGFELPQLPFAALALGGSGVGAGQRRAVELLADLLDCGEPNVIRDTVYFLGELGDVAGAWRLLPRVIGLARAGAGASRAASWAWGKLGAAAGSLADVGHLQELARDHLEPWVRAEAVIALGRIARAAAPILLRDVMRALSDDDGEVRYGAMQALRLAAEDGFTEATDTAVAHDEDPDFGVAFERALAIEGMAGRV